MNNLVRRATAFGAVALALALFPSPARAGGYDISSCYEKSNLVWSSCDSSPKGGWKQICLQDVCKLDASCNYKSCAPTPVWFQGQECTGVKVCDVGKGCLSLCITSTDGKTCCDHSCVIQKCDFDNLCKSVCAPPCTPKPPCEGGKVPEPTSLLLLGLGGLGASRTLRRRLKLAVNT